MTLQSAPDWHTAQLFTQRKLSPGSVTNHLSALRFFYIQTLKKPWSIADTPYPKKAHRLPTILSQEEVAQLIDAACTPFHRTLLMTLYATGVRNRLRIGILAREHALFTTVEMSSERGLRLNT